MVNKLYSTLGWYVSSHYIILNKEIMKDQLIKPDTAKLARDKEFGKTLDTIYPMSYRLSDNKLVLNSQNNTLHTHTSAPTQSELQKWLREIHNIDVMPKILGNKVYRNNIYKNKIYIITAGLSFDFEEALEIALFDALKLIKL